MLEKINGEYQCEHVAKDITDGDCVYCHLTVAEIGLEKTKEKLKVIKDALWKIFIDYDEDNPDRHINLVSAAQVAGEALKKIGEKI